MILGYILNCAGGCGLRMIVSTRIPHWCDACRDRSQPDHLPLGQVRG